MVLHLSVSHSVQKVVVWFHFLSDEWWVGVGDVVSWGGVQGVCIQGHAEGDSYTVGIR